MLKEKEFWGHFIAALAALSSAATLIAFTFDWNNDNTPLWFSITSFIIIIIACFFYAEFMAQKKQKICLELNPDLKVDIEVGDLFTKKGIVVIPVNEYFDTIVDDQIIAHNSIHGKFIDTYFKDRLSELDVKIEQALSSIKEKESNPTRSRGKQNKYPLGTCISIRDGENIYVLFAFTHFNETNNAYIDTKEVYNAVVKLMLYLDKIANGKSVFLPVFGTGLSRLKKKPQRMLLYILECIDFMEKITLNGGLHIICYNSKDYNLNDVEKYFTNNRL